MKAENCIEVAAAAAGVWEVFADVERWPEWTESIQQVMPLDGPGLAVGHRFEIKQPRLPRVVWEVTEVIPGASWTWRNESFGATTTAAHEVSPRGADRSLVRQCIEQRGPVGLIIGVLLRGVTKRYLQLEAAGLKARSEQRSGDASSA